MDSLAQLATLVRPWIGDALCREYPDVDFFPTAGASSEPAKAVCRECLVVAECLTYAIDERIDHGVFGATTAAERAELRADAGPARVATKTPRVRQSSRRARASAKRKATPGRPPRSEGGAKQAGPASTRSSRRRAHRSPN